MGEEEEEEEEENEEDEEDEEDEEEEEEGRGGGDAPRQSHPTHQECTPRSLPPSALRHGTPHVSWAAPPRVLAAKGTRPARTMAPQTRL